MSGFTQSESERIINGYFGNGAYTVPDDLWIGLFTADPIMQQAYAEADYQGYARISTVGKFAPAVNGQTHNILPLFFPEFIDDGNFHDSINYVAFCKTSTVGDFSSIIATGKLSKHIWATPARSIVFDANNITFALV